MTTLELVGCPLTKIIGSILVWHVHEAVVE